MIDAAQIRAARALLRWSQEDLAKTSGVSLQTIKNTENGRSVPHHSSIAAIQECFEMAGVEFLDRSGTRMRGDMVRVYEGEKALDQFWQDLFLTMSIDNGGEYIAFGLEEQKFWENDAPATDRHIERIRQHGNIKCRALIVEGDEELPSPHIQYRALSKEYFSSVPFYVYKNKLGLIVWGPPTQIIVIDNIALAEAYLKQFNVIWSIARQIVPKLKASK